MSIFSRISGPSDHGFVINIGRWSFVVLLSKDEAEEELTAEAAADVLQAMADDPELAREVWYRLEDRATLAQGDLQRGLEEMRRGEFIPLGKDVEDDPS